MNILFNQLTSSIGLIKDSRLRVIAVAVTRRAAALPDVPTLDESGVKGYEVSNFLGILALAHTPRPVIVRLNRVLRKVLAMPAVKERFRPLGNDPGASTPEEFGMMIRSELNEWCKVARNAHLKFN